MSDLDLRHAAGDCVAGDLDANEAALFEQLRAKDPAVQADQAFWQRLRPALGSRADTPTAAPDLCADILARADREGLIPTAVRRRRRREFPTLLTALIAAGLALAIGLPVSRAWSRSALVAVAYDDSGRPMQRASDESDRVRPTLVAVDSPRAVSASRRPWLGLYTRPVDLTGTLPHHRHFPGRSARGHEVVRVLEDGPAHRAGIRAGDVLFDVGGCPLETDACLAHALAEHRPGEPIAIRVFEASTGTLVERQVVLGAMSE